MTRRIVFTIGLAIVLAGAATALVMTGAGRTLVARISGQPGEATATMGQSTEEDDGMSHPAGAGTQRGEVVIDARRQQLIGVRTVTVSRVSAAPVIRAVGTVRYDETRLADINLKLEGWIRDLYVDYVGKPVRKGQPLFTLYSPEILATQNEYLLALGTRDRLAKSSDEVREHTDDLVAAARQRLMLWDIPPEEVARLEDTRTAQGIVVFRSPVDGVVIDKQVVKGAHVMPGQTLFKVADLSSVWVEADVYEREAPAVRIGTPATVTVDAYPGERFPGRTLFVHPTVEEQTRTIKVRFAFANRGGRLKPGMYANVDLEGRAASSVLVPTDAVLDSGTEQVVFVAQGEGRFEPRRVKVGRRLQAGIEVLDGVNEGEQVATGAAFFLDSESQLRGSLQGYQSPPAVAGSAPTPAAALDISLRTQPDPLKVGENVFEVVVKDASGAPVPAAEVSVQFYMPPMPTMGMPAMRNTFALPPAGAGVYRARGEVPMAGRWDVTVTVTKNGQRLGSKQLTVAAR